MSEKASETYDNSFGQSSQSSQSFVPPAGQPSGQPIYFQVPRSYLPQVLQYYSVPTNDPADPLLPPPYTEKPVQNVQNVQQEVVLMVSNSQLPRHSAKLKCPHCNRTVDSVVQYEDNALVWALCIVLFIFTCLCCIPFCIDDLKDAVHYCPICKSEIAKNQRLI